MYECLQKQVLDLNDAYGKNDRIPIMQSLFEVYGVSVGINGGFINMDYNSCKSYTINFDTGAVHIITVLGLVVVTPSVNNRRHF